MVFFITKGTNIIYQGLLIAIADTFSSYVVKYLCPEEDFMQFLSVRILLTSYQNIYESNEKELKMVVTLNHKIDRDIILNKSNFLKWILQWLLVYQENY